MRNGKGLVQIQMANVRANMTGRRQANLGIHVGAIHVDLPAVFVDDSADFQDALLKDAMRGGISHHHGAQRFFVRSALARRSAISILPDSSQSTTTTSKPAIAALAGLVPCAELGMRQVVRWPSPRSR